MASPPTVSSPMESHINRWVEPYCVLCRVALPQNVYDPAIHGNRNFVYTQEWDADVVMFFHIPHDGTGKWHRGSFHIDFLVADTLTGFTEGLRTRGFTECAPNQDCDQCARQRRHGAHFIHGHCFQLARRFFRETFSFARLVTAARYAQTVKAGVHMRLDRVHAASVFEAYFATTGDKSTTLGQLLSTVSRQLPPELQTMVNGHMEGWVRSIHGCMFNLDFHFRRFFEDQPADFTESVLFPLAGSPELQILGLKQTSILGQPTICEVGAAAGEDWHHTLELDPDLAVTGLQLSFGLYGLVAVKVLYENGTESDWLGGSTRRFYRTLQTRDLRRMRVTFDGFKIVDLDLPIDNEPCPHPESVLMNLDTRLHPARTYPVVDNTALEPPPAAHFAYYIQLPPTNQRLECLTMWVSSGAVTNIQVNGDGDTRLSAHPPPWHARPVTYYFRPEETIESFHLLWHPGNAHRQKFGPLVILITSLGRTLYFGQYLNSMDTDAHLQVMGNFRTHRLTGIVMEPRKNVVCLGAAIEPRREQLSEIHEQILLPFRSPVVEGQQEDVLDWPNVARSAFLSRASLANTVRLRLQKHINRVTGLYIEHRDGSVEILGHYDPGKPETIESFYDAGEDGPLEAVTFGWTNATRPAERVMLGIQAGRHYDRENYFIWDDFSQEASWLSAEKCDLVEYWNGGLLEFTRMPAPPTQLLQFE